MAEDRYHARFQIEHFDDEAQKWERVDESTSGFEAVCLAATRAGQTGGRYRARDLQSSDLFDSKTADLSKLELFAIRFGTARYKGLARRTAAKAAANV